MSALINDEIWDVHVHLAGLEGRTTEEKLGGLMAVAERMQIARLCISMGWRWSYDPTPDDFRRQNDEVIEAVAHWQHRCFPLAYVNPRYEKESVKEIERCVDHGPCVGIKLWVAVRCHEECLDRIVQTCHASQGIIVQHTWWKTTGNLPGESTPRDLAELAQRHPHIPFIMAHSGGNWEYGIRCVRAHENVWIETAGFDPAAGFIEFAIREVGAERIVFGSDAPGRSFASQLGKVESANLTQAQRRAIYQHNLRRLLTPILRRKGIG
ncbi:MAG: hypothetical protein KatS3mg113_0465 [Planctomycetaceae bacterium]|nr:MAG: hypothetical protein KatS3mg113_0465 [Planctomycetaceae bacterium]